MRRVAGEPATSRPHKLAQQLVDTIGDRIVDGRLAAGTKLPTEAGIMAEYGVSRTVVREALSRLQAAGQVLTRHGIGTFVVGPGQGASFRITPEQLATVKEVIAILELRIGLETEAAALAAQRRTEANLRVMRAALDEFEAALRSGRDAIAADFRFHLEIARATQNANYAELMASLGRAMIPRARIDVLAPLSEDRRDYLRRVNSEHENLYDAIARQDSEAARAAMRTHISNSKQRQRQAQTLASSRSPGTQRANQRGTQTGSLAKALAKTRGLVR